MKRQKAQTEEIVALLYIVSAKGGNLVSDVNVTSFTLIIATYSSFKPSTTFFDVLHSI